MAAQLDISTIHQQGARQYQEDSLYVAQPAQRPWLGVVADGMGGHQGGDVASDEGIKAIEQYFSKNHSKSLPMQDVLVNAVTKGHHAVLQAAKRLQHTGNMGATVSAIIIDGATLYWSSAGDSRIYLCRGGKIEQLSRDFTLGMDLEGAVLAGEITEEERQSHPQKDALTSFMGTDNWREHHGSRHLRNNDIVIVCTDGIYGTVGNEGIIKACVQGSNKYSYQIGSEIKKRVTKSAKKNQDNYTAIIVKISLPKLSFFASNSSKGIQSTSSLSAVVGRKNGVFLQFVLVALGLAMAAVGVILFLQDGQPFGMPPPASDKVIPSTTTKPSVQYTPPPKIGSIIDAAQKLDALEKRLAEANIELDLPRSRKITDDAIQDLKDMVTGVDLVIKSRSKALYQRAIIQNARTRLALVKKSKSEGTIGSSTSMLQTALDRLELLSKNADEKIDGELIDNLRLEIKISQSQAKTAENPKKNHIPVAVNGVSGVVSKDRAHNNKAEPKPGKKNKKTDQGMGKNFPELIHNAFESLKAHRSHSGNSPVESENTESTK
jgi:protein phosphatase